MFRKSVLISALFLTNFLGAFASELVVEVTDVPSSNGSVELRLFDSAGGERLTTPVIIMRQPAGPAGVSLFRVGGLLPGLYAVVVYHDEDNSGGLTMGLLRGPTEATAISNLQQRLSSPPLFNDTAFAIPENGITITMTLRK